MRTIDVIGVATDVGQLGTVNLKAGGTKDRRNITLADESNLTISVSLWGKNAAKLFEFGSVVAIKGARVSDYGGKSLNCGDEHS